MTPDFKQIEQEQFAIHPAACEWTMRAMSVLRNRVDINIKLHGEREHIAQGDIFMFNHFARFETFIPQYLIALETGVYCRSVASSEFFVEDNALSKYLRALGGVPNNYARLLPFLAEEILRGGKVVIFPEGGMVKDRRVMTDESPFIGRRPDYSIYSRSADQRRAHHTGAAVLALGLDGFKTGLSWLIEHGHPDEILRWADILGTSTDQLRTAIVKPTLMFPANITFHPLRVDQNLLARGAEMFKGGLSPKMAEELIIEGNLILKRTDMDIRLGDPVYPHERFNWLDQRLLGRIVRHAKTVDDLFRPARDLPRLGDRVIQNTLTRHVHPLRDQCMAVMYSNITLNVSHLAARLMKMMLADGETEVDIDRFDKTIYLAIKNVQQATNVHLHRGILNPAAYIGIFDHKCPQIRQFIDSAVQLGLIERRDGKYCFLPKLQAEAGFDQIRMDNPVMVYANEMAPIQAAWDALKAARKQIGKIKPAEFARLRFDDEMRAWQWNWQKFHRPQFATINDQETATLSGAPYLHLPEPSRHSKTGILVVHGFLASPAELRNVGDHLATQGHAVLGVRLSGHGTSPHDLQTRNWQDWLASVQRGYDILSAFCDRVVIVGFSTGAALSAIFAASHPPRLAGLLMASAPLKFRNRNLMFVPLLYGANKLMGWVPNAGEMLGFRPNQSEHPETNYRHIPINGLYHLRRAVAEMNDRLAHIDIPVLILQADNDQIVDPVSANMIARRLTGTINKTVRMLESDRHGVLNENIGDALHQVAEFVRQSEDFTLSDRPEAAIGAAALPMPGSEVDETAILLRDDADENLSIADTEANTDGAETSEANSPLLSARDKSLAILARAGFGKLAVKKDIEAEPALPDDPAQKPTDLSPAQPE
ncbi:alpha/beta fold hydrolase [Thalassospira marina]|uniref:Alpha/beta hydrolase n=1 Tax=Thalassospira marina TaxID=2048283 RepID=A0A2N3KW06_9PROT|nr:alpha/beta fold hydrolase [Thalassospira marina]PKR54761.1 alpha/beta hydrolase [Thalassospira marina]